MMEFQDHFSGAAEEYAAYRPRYPAKLFEYVAGLSPGRRLAWDCGTGNGQAATGLADHFERIVATDASDRQIESATPHPKVEYRTAPAESSGLDAETIDLVTVAQALHWFDRPRFYEEVRRVLVPGGLLAVWCYELMEIDPAVDEITLRFYRDEVGSYWPPERALVEEGYRSIAFPFDEIETPPFCLEAPMDLDRFAGYLRTWSAVTRYRTYRGTDPVLPLLEELAPTWGNPKETKVVRWPLSLRAGHRTGTRE